MAWNKRFKGWGLPNLLPPEEKSRNTCEQIELKCNSQGGAELKDERADTDVYSAIHKTLDSVKLSLRPPRNHYPPVRKTLSISIILSHSAASCSPVGPIQMAGLV